MISSDKKKIAAAASEIRVQYSDGSFPVRVENIPDQIDIDLVYKKEFSDGLSGLMKREGKSNKPVIAINKNHPKVRQRFSIAHELGHFFLHTSENLLIDTGVTFFRDDSTTTASDKKEVEANLFAAELLMPSIEIKKELAEFVSLEKGTIGNFISKLSNKFGVSEQAMTIRIGSLLN